MSSGGALRTALAAALAGLASSQLPPEHSADPSLVWNQAIRSPPGNKNAVQISPDGKWLYVNSFDGKLSKLDPTNGDYVAVFAPEPREDAGFPWYYRSTGGGISFHVDDSGEGGDSYLVYSIRDVPRADVPEESRVIAIRHDDSRALEAIWTAIVPGRIAGTPVIGSEGKFVYLTANARPSQLLSSSSSSSAPPPPTESPIEPPIDPPAPPPPPVAPPPTELPTESPPDAPPPDASSPSAAPVAAAPAPTGAEILADVVGGNDADAAGSDASGADSEVAWNDETVVAATPSPVAAPAAAANATAPIDDGAASSPGAAAAVPATAPVASTPAPVLFAKSSPSDAANGAANDATNDAAIDAANDAAIDATNQATNDTEPMRQRPHDDAFWNERRGRRDLRDLQSSDDRTGLFLVLSHPRDGAAIYRFDSRSVLSVQKHRFADVGIARRPSRGNYHGGEGNAHDVLMWGSLEDGTDVVAGETCLFQLPPEFDGFDDPYADASDFRARVMESVGWSTSTRPTLSSSGLEVYFAATGNRLTGWNRGQKFDVVANLGPIPLPPESENLGDDSAARPIVLAEEDELLIITSTDNNAMFGVEASTGNIKWTLDDMGTGSFFTEPKLSPDGTVAYFGKDNAVHAINVTDGSQLWGAGGYEHPFNNACNVPMFADLSLSSDGEVLYYARCNTAISAIRVAEVIPTDEPTATPSSNPSGLSSSSPSQFPSLVSSTAPSHSPSMPPSRSITPTVTSSTRPSVDPDPSRPSSPPTLSYHPSDSPSVSHSARPSSVSSTSPSTTPSLAVASSVTSSPVTSSPVTSSPVTSSPVTSSPVTSSPVILEGGIAEPPSSSPVVTAAPPTFNTPSSAAASPEDSNTGESSSALSRTALIGIIAGGGAALLIIVGACIVFAYKRRNGEDDGVDTDWQTSNNNSQNPNAVEEGATFQYSTEDASNRQPPWGEGELRW
ncbi:hypothetical protein ACHAWF_011212 [Thalassiosira exigua]